jgi:RimJ/RimL family protein N-acetyltransferase
MTSDAPHTRLRFDHFPVLQTRRLVLGEIRGGDAGLEALEAITDFGFGKMQLNRVEVLIDTRNVPSARLAESLGLVRERIPRENTPFRGRYLDDAVYSFLRRE